MTISASTPLRVVVLLTSVALTLILLLTGAVVARATDGTPVAASAIETVTVGVEHRVSPGDTLWEIAAVYTDPGDDIRDTIYDIKVANDLESSVIVVGETLIIPLDF